MDTRSRVMGISPGTRTMGIAVLIDGKLRDWQLKTFSGPWSKNKLHWIVSAVKQIIALYSITEVSIKLPHASRTSKGLNEVTKAIQTLAEKKELSISTFTLTDLEQAFPGTAKATKKALVAEIANRFPELQEYYEKTVKKPTSPFQKVFEAVALAVLIN